MATKISTRGTPTHYKMLTYGVGIEIVGFDYGIKDYVKWRWIGERKVHRNLIHYTSNGLPFFKVNGGIHYLAEFTRY